MRSYIVFQRLEMQVTLILAEAVTNHKDGTFSLLRGGITRLQGDTTGGIVFRGALLIRIAFDPLEIQVQHAFKVSCVTADGQDVGLSVTGEIEVQSGTKYLNFAVNLQHKFSRAGDYEFAVSMNNNQMASWPLSIQSTKQKVRSDAEDAAQ